MFIGSWITYLENFIFVPRCALCDRVGSLCCLNHGSEFKSFEKPYFFDDLKVYSSFSYQDVSVKRLLYRFKYKGFYGLSDFMGYCMGQSLLVEKESLFVPIPLYWSRRVWRGYNQSFLLAKRVGVLHDKPVVTDLVRRKKGKQQARLTKSDRAKNVENIFVWKGSSLKGKTVYLVDDVCTTGSTLKSASQVLHKAGAKEVIGIVFARG